MLFQFPAAYNDIALIRINPKLTLEEDIRKICLPQKTNDEPNTWFRNSVNLIGYGATDSDETNPLRSAKLDIVETSYCIDEYNNGKNLRKVGPKIRRNLPGNPLIRKSQLCAIDDGVRDDVHGSCAGDSGSPAIRRNYRKNAFEQVAVVHGSVGSCRADIFPTVFTRLDDPNIFEFINKHLNGNDQFI